MTLWFTSDSHFGHDAIRRLADRPFASLDAMDASLIERWNSVVGPDDEIWHLGDFVYRTADSVESYRNRLNGRIHLVAGNHDQRTVKQHSSLFASVHTLTEIHTGGRSIVLCHYPMREWDKAWRGSWHLHGHVHGRLDAEPFGFSLDVGVDSHDYAPIDVARIAALFENRTNPFKQSEDRAEQSRRQNAERRRASLDAKETIGS